MSLFWARHAELGAPITRIRLVKAADNAAAAALFGIERCWTHDCHTLEHVIAAKSRPDGEIWEVDVTKIPSAYDRFDRCGPDYLDELDQAGFDIF